MFSLLAAALLLGSVDSVARDAMDFKFTVCGIPHRFQDRRIDWNFNPTYNGYQEWPGQFARMQFLPTLAIYYRRTGDERAARTYVEILASFIDTVPPATADMVPSATRSWRTIDTGQRATSWVDSYFAFTNSPAMTPGFRAKFMRSLEDHLRRLEPRKTSSNWRILELRGLVDITLAFPSVSRAAERRRKAECELAEILRKQLYPDGFHFELATGYHTILDRNYIRLANRYRQFGVPPPPFLERDVERAFELYPHLTRPDCNLPPLNDSNPVSIRGRMKVASRLYPSRKDFLWFATDGREGEKPGYLSYAFPYSGAVVFRDSWSRDAVWGYVDMSPFGRSHQHEDKLNFLLFAYGKEMICDAGNYAYDGSEMRKYVISTRAHNTIRIDGKDQNARRSWKWTTGMLRDKAKLDFATTPNRDFAKAAFTLGYGSGEAFDDAVTHERTVEFVKDRGAPFFRITDELRSKDDREHAYEQMWHLEACGLTLSDGAFTADFGDGVWLEAKAESENGKFADMIGTKKAECQGWMPISPPGPHEHRPIHTPVLKGTFRRATVIRVLLCPKRGRR